MVSSRVYPDLDRSPKKNWVEKAGGLPDYIERVAKHIHYEGGKEISRAIAMAISQVKKWAAQGKAEAIKAVAQWEKMKASGHAKAAVQMSAQRIVREVVELSYSQEGTRSTSRGPYKSHVGHTRQFGRKKGNLKKPADWHHEYVPLNQRAGAVKAKHISKSDLDSTGHPKAGKADDVKKPLPASAAIAGTGRKEQQTGEERAKAAKVPTQRVKKTPQQAKATLRTRRNALQRKVTAQTATPEERRELNSLITKLKGAS
jgi:hypothetical protein